MKSKELLKKKILTAMTGISLAVMMAFSFNMTAHASEAVEDEIETETETTEGIQPRQAIIDWRFKIEDGKLYRRLYNYTEQCWVGDWILCG